MAPSIALAPFPRQLSFGSGSLNLAENGLICLESANPQPFSFSGLRIQQVLKTSANLEWKVFAGNSSYGPKNKIILRLAPERSPQIQSYRLHILNQSILIEGHDYAGIFYGACTLAQILRQYGRAIPCLEIQDWPDFPSRGVMLDISRDKVYQMATLYELVDRLAGLKINQLQLYTEHTFAYLRHPEVWKDASPMTGEDILALDRFCRDRFIELVPNQNSFGHMERWLKLDRYAPLAEIHGEFSVPWGTAHGPFSIAPFEPGSLELVSGLYDELLPHFSSRMVNIGCDETFDLGFGKSKAICAEKGVGRVYLDFLLNLYADLSRRGQTVQFWGDIILRHPDLVGALPRDMIALEWGYEDKHPFAEHGKAFADSGIPFYVCPGTSTWNTLVGKTDNCLANLLNAAENGLAYGAIGYLITDWGDAGHWQPPVVSLLGFTAGAAYSWSVSANRSIDMARAVSLFGFEDPSGEMGRLAYELGNVYLKAGAVPENSSALDRILKGNLNEMADLRDVKGDNLLAVKTAAETALGRLEKAMMARPDTDLVQEEFRMAAHLVTHACQRGLWCLGGPGAPSGSELRADMIALVEQYQRVWLRRNRPGGLKDSIRRFEELIEEYQK